MSAPIGTPIEVSRVAPSLLPINRPPARRVTRLKVRSFFEHLQGNSTSDIPTTNTTKNPVVAAHYHHYLFETFPHFGITIQHVPPFEGMIARVRKNKETKKTNNKLFRKKNIILGDDACDRKVNTSSINRMGIFLI